MIPQEMKLLNMLSNNNVTFYIPPYQRNYEWTEEQCKVFLEDVKKTCEQNLVLKKNTEHFFGSITFFQTEKVFGQPNKLVLIDGQQRITTTMLFLAALRDLIDGEVLSSYINDNYLMNKSVAAGDEFKIKLKQVEADWETYKEIIFRYDVSVTTKSSAVYRNYKYFYNKLVEYREQGGNLSELVGQGLDKFSVITIELKPEENKWENPQEIFESMNSLGKPLSLADLVRNYLLLGLDADTQDVFYHRYWLAIERAVPGQVSNYIRDFMQWKARVSYKQASENNYKELYSLFKDIFAGKDSESILKELANRASLYAAIVGNHDFGNKDIDYVLSDLQYLRITTAYSFLLALLAAFSDGRFTVQEVIDILNVFRIYILRRKLMRVASSSENKSFPLLVNHLDGLISAVDKRAKMFDILAHQEANLRLPNDIEIARYLETANFHNFQYSKYFLALVEETITKSRPDLSDTKLQLEHIMPQTLNPEWRHDLGENCDEMHQELVDTIGNLTLIRHNQELGNKPFDVKKDVYENNSGLQIAKTEITKYEMWNEDTIRCRANWIINFILRNVLPIPDSMRKSNNYATKEKQGLSFEKIGIIGQEINFIADPTIVAKVIDDTHVEFEGKKMKLSPLTRDIQKRRGVLSPSGSYSGAMYWEYDGVRISDYYS